MCTVHICISAALKEGESKEAKQDLTQAELDDEDAKANVKAEEIAERKRRISRKGTAYHRA